MLGLKKPPIFASDTMRVILSWGKALFLKITVFSITKRQSPCTVSRFALSLFGCAALPLNKFHIWRFIMSDIKKRPIRFILLFYLVCFAFRAVEYLVIRTDQSVIGEAFIHKLIGIALLALTVRFIKIKWSDIGFVPKRAAKGICYGLLFGGVVFAIAYGSEFLLQASAENAPALRFYVASYTTTGDPVIQNGFWFVLLCIAGNTINVIMEEGVFRGLFIRLAAEKHSFIKASLFSAFLFGIWHIAQPVRNVLDCVQSPGVTVMMGLMLVTTSALAGIQYALLYKLTGALWFSMAAHFVNNTIVNLLHVVTVSGADAMQSVRIAIAQTISFVVVLIVFIIKSRNAHKK
jgi:membrane protease YdiL (CAAX protease family)